MKIGIDATDLSIRNYKGGVYHYTVNLLRGLEEVDRDNEYVLFFNYFYQHHRPYCEEAMALVKGSNMRIRLSRFPRTLRRKLRLPVNLFIGPVDVFHGPFDTLLPVFGCRKVITIHDMRYFDVYHRLRELVPGLDNYSFDFPTFRGWNMFMSNMKESVRSSATRTDGVITVSQSTKEAVIEHMKVEEDRVYVVPNGVSSAFKPVMETVSLERTLAAHALDRPYFLFVGQFDPFKNILRIIDAFNIIRQSNKHYDHRLVLVTPTGEGYWFSQVVEQKMAETGLDGDITILRNLPNEELPHLYAGATALLLPSLYEGFGIPAVEAMATGTPVIASDACSLPEVVGDAGIVVDPMASDSIAQGMISLLEDADRRQELALRGLAKAQTYSWQNTAKGTAEVYRTLLQ